MKVAFLPVWQGNPYHVELARALGTLGIDISFPDSLKELHRAFLSGAADVNVLHLHALPYLNLTPVNGARYVCFYQRLSELRRRGLRVIWTVHDFRNHDASLWRIENAINRRLAHRMDALIVHGNTAKEIIESEWGPFSPAMISVIPHGNYLRSYANFISREVARASLGLGASSIVFLFLGLIRPYKGVPQMVKAFKECSHEAAQLVIAGDLLNRALQLEIETSIRGDTRIVFRPGRVADDSIQMYMNACDVVVLPYKRVFTSGAAVLAMSFGKPCIAPRAGCVVDALDENGAVFFDSAIDHDLRRAFETVPRARERLEQMGNHNLQRAATWGWDGIARRTADVYGAVIRR